MRLLHVRTLTFSEFYDNVPPYITASHRWKTGEEAMIDDISSGLNKESSGYKKVEGFAAYIREHVGHIEWLWIDTCCVKQDSSLEVSETVNSMFHIYSQAEACLAYLVDVTCRADENEFRRSDWFSRGWTLQELLAPHVVLFLTKDWEPIGYKGAQGWTKSGVHICTGPALETTVSSVTGISETVLHNYNQSKSLSVDERLSWIQSRRTTRAEDMSYSLFGLFNVSTFVNYGEGAQKARTRLLEEINKASAKPTPLAMNAPASHSNTLCFYLPFGENRRFVGRATEIEALNRRFFLEQDCQKLAIVGLGGIGKTQVALNFAYSVKHTHPDYSVFWISALSMESFEQSFQNIAYALNLQCGQNQDVKQLVQRHLASSSAGKWILIVDNVDDMDITFGFGTTSGLVNSLPESPLGSILFTSRNFEVAQSLVGSNIIEIDRMEEAEGLSLLERSLVQKDLLGDKTVATDVVNELQGLPLAIIQAAAYMSKNRITPIDYLALLRDAESEMIEVLSTEIRDHTRDAQAANAVATTWIISFNQMDKRDPTASELLQFISCIEWKAVPQSILPNFGSKAKLLNAIGTLRAYSFVTKRQDEELYDLHRLVHLAARIWNGQYKDRATTQEHAIHHLAQIFVDYQWENRLIWRAYLPHVARIRNDMTNKTASGKGDLCWRVGRCLIIDGRYKEAVVWSEESCHLRQTLPEDHPDRLQSQAELGYAYHMNAQYPEAIRLLEHVVAIREKTLPEDDTNRLTSQLYLSYVYKGLHRMDKALHLLKHIVKVRERTLADDDAELLRSRKSLAAVYRDHEQQAMAIPILEHVVKIQEALMAEDHPEILHSQHELASAYLQNGQVERAINLFEHVVQVQDRVLDEAHFNRIASQHALARAYLDNEQVERAIDLFEHVVRMQERVLHEDNPDHLSSQHELARAYFDNGRVERAVDLFEHVVRLRERTLNEDHPERLVSEHMLAVAYRQNGKTQRAIELLERVIGIKESVLPPYHPQLHRSLDELVAAYRENGDFEMADQLSERIGALQDGTPLAANDGEEESDQSEPNTVIAPVNHSVATDINARDSIQKANGSKQRSSWMARVKTKMAHRHKEKRER